MFIHWNERIFALMWHLFEQFTWIIYLRELLHLKGAYQTVIFQLDKWTNGFRVLVRRPHCPNQIVSLKSSELYLRWSFLKCCCMSQRRANLFPHASHSWFLIFRWTLRQWYLSRYFAWGPLNLCLHSGQITRPSSVALVISCPVSAKSIKFRSHIVPTNINIFWRKLHEHNRILRLKNSRCVRSGVYLSIS